MFQKLALRDDDYLYSSARVRARAAGGIDDKALLRMADAPDVHDVFKILSEYSVNVIYKDGAPDTEGTLDAYQNAEFNAVCGFMPNPAICGILRYPYDAHNIKAMIKSEIRGDGAQDLLIDSGSVKAKLVAKMVKERDFTALPENMAHAAAEAIDTFSTTSDPQAIDLIIDKACFADMLALASSSNKAFFIELVKAKIDVTNILTAIRVLRMYNSGDFTYFMSAYANGGRLGSSFYEKAFGSGEDGLFDMLKRSEYSYIARALEEGKSLSNAELACENCYINKVKDSYSIAYGAEVPFAYLAIKDFEIKNIRIIIASKKAGLSASEIRRRLRGMSQ